jgi:O-acetyl-ADP-ribose deacetylase (regulator of RNase III)
MPFEILRQDITRMAVDAIVNAANAALEPGGGVCGAIFAAAGMQALAQECQRIGPCATGEAVLTGGYALAARHIIHTVGPVWQGGGHGEEALLAACYTNSLELARSRGLTSVAFPLISSGIYGYPKDQALRVAVSAIGGFLLRHDMTVYLTVFDREAYDIGAGLFSSIQAFIDDRFVEEHPFANRIRHANANLTGAAFAPPPIAAPMASPAKVLPAMAAPRRLEDLLAQRSETFSQALLRLIDEKGRKDSDVYKRANIDRRLFSKIRSNGDYQPSKATALAFAVALELNLDETRDLLGRAGFALSHSSKADLIVEYFITDGNHNIFEINQALFAFGESLLGA